MEITGAKHTKTCTGCSEMKILDLFPTNKNIKDGRQSRCRECYNKANRKRDKTCYVTWRGMKERCTSPNHKNYNLYKDRWHLPWSEFKVFEKWALVSGWKKGLTIDRIDATLGYSPENCQWLTRSENTAKGNIERSIKKAHKNAFLNLLRKGTEKL